VEEYQRFMDSTTPDIKVREALAAIGQYFSDTIPPVQAAEALETLLYQQAQLMSTEIINWISTQFRISGKTTSVADYLYHAVCKLQYLAQLQLISEHRLTPYLDAVKQRLLEYCPVEDRSVLQENFSNIDTSDAAGPIPVNFMYRKVKAGVSESEHEIAQPARGRRHSILWERIKTEVRNPSMPDARVGRDEFVPNLIATVAADAQSGQDFRNIQNNLKSLGLPSGTDQIFRTLGQGLPGWAIATPTQPGDEKSNNPAIKAMSQIIHVAEDKWESSKRFQDLVQAAIEQFNTGSLARAVTMLDLALGFISEGKLDQAVASSVRKTAHRSLDLNRLRDLIKENNKHRLLRKVLNFFEEYTIQNILDSLQQENRRERRKLLLGLLEVYGNDARKPAFERLKTILAGTDIKNDWFFARNLVCTLDALPRSSDIPLDTKMEVLTQLLKLNLPAPLVKEAIKYAGQIKCSQSEELLISTTEALEKIVFEHAASDKDPAQMLSLLDRAVFTLAHYGTPKACRAVVKHGASGYQEWGDPASRLAYLSGQDLSSDQESLSRLIKLLKSKTPRKLLGLTIHKNDQLVLHAIRALSSTPAQSVRQVFKDIAGQFPDTKFGQAANNALRDFEASDKSVQQDQTMSGDLDLFGLPDLLQEMNSLQLTGPLNIKDAKGNLRGTFLLNTGRILNCSAGHMEGVEAAYQLLEKPIEGSFLFQGRKDDSTKEPTKEQKFPELSALLAEGMRRYDELQRARAILPDSVRFKRKGPEPAPPVQPDDKELFTTLWQKTADGATPEECEASCPVDSYRVRTLLARWIEEGVLLQEPGVRSQKPE
jgi:hypothetical protein